MKKRIIIIIVLSFILLSGCITNNNGNDKNNNKIFSINKYQIETITNNSENYSIYLPIPLSSGNLTDLIKMINNTNYNQELIDTIYGKALKINAKGNITILLESNEKQPMALSMVEKEESGYGNKGNWVYFSNNKTTILLSISLIETNNKETFYEKQWIENYTLKEGWQLIKFKGDSDVSD